MWKKEQLKGEDMRWRGRFRRSSSSIVYRGIYCLALTDRGLTVGSTGCCCAAMTN